VGARFSAPFQTGSGAYPASCTMGTGSFPGVMQPGRGVDHPPTSSAEVYGKSRAISLLPLWAFMACFRATFTLSKPLLWCIQHVAKCRTVRADVSSLWSPVMSLRIPLKAGDFLSCSRRVRLHRVNVIQMSLTDMNVIWNRATYWVGWHLCLVWTVLVPAPLVVSLSFSHQMSGFCFKLGLDGFILPSVILPFSTV
jgi:hypothetical protein